MAKWLNRPGARHLQSRQFASASHHDRVGLVVGETPARQCAERLVPCACGRRTRTRPPGHDRRPGPKASDRALALPDPRRSTGGSHREGGLIQRAALIEPSHPAREIQLSRELAGGPHNVLAARCRDKDWFRSTEPDDLEHEEFWCSRGKRRPDVRFCGVVAAGEKRARADVRVQ